MSKKVQSILSLIEIAENNLHNAKTLLAQILDEKGASPNTESTYKNISSDESQAIEVVEGYFDGEGMMGDNGQNYTVPQNYASKTQLVIGDRMKWMLTPDREIYKLIGQAARERIIGTFSMEGDSFVVITEQHPKPVKILKASATFAMKNLGLNFGDEVVIIVPKGVTPTWGAFSSVVKTLSESEKNLILNNDKANKEIDQNVEVREGFTDPLDMEGYIDATKKSSASDYL
jgi:hypothetical protein